MITKEKLKDKVHDLISSVQGCKATELVTKLDRDILEALEVHDLSSVLAELILEHRIIEIEYVLPQLNYRTKSFLLPAGTEVKVNT